MRPWRVPPFASRRERYVPIYWVVKSDGPTLTAGVRRSHRHCERSEEISISGGHGGCLAALAMTGDKGSGQAALQHFIDQRRIGPACHGLHNLADQRTKDFFFAGLVLIDESLVGFENARHDSFDLIQINNLAQSSPEDDLIGNSPAFNSRLEHILGDLSIDRFILDAIDQLSEMFRTNGRVFDRTPGPVQRR